MAKKSAFDVDIPSKLPKTTGEQQNSKVSRFPSTTVRKDSIDIPSFMQKEEEEIPSLLSNSDTERKSIELSDSLLAEDVKNMSKQLKSTLRDKEYLESSLSTTRTNIKSLEEENLKLKVKLEMLEEYKDTRKKLEKGIESAIKEEEITNVFDVIKNFEAQLDEMFTIRDALEIELKKTKRDLEAVKAANLAQEGIIEGLKSEAMRVQELKDSLSFAEQEVSDTLNKINVLEKHHELLKEERDALKEKLSETRNVVSEIETEREELMGKIDELEKIFRKNQQEKNKVEEEKDAALRQIKKLEKQLENALFAKNALELELERSKKSLAEIKGAIMQSTISAKKRYYERQEK